MHTIPDQVLSAFGIDSNAIEISLLKRGHIHQTFLLKALSDGEPLYVVQKINALVFQNVELLTENVLKISEFIRAAKGHLGAARVLQTDTNAPCFKSNSGEYWRTFEYVADSVNFQICESKQLAASAAKGCALFHQTLLNFPLASIKPAIPGFQDIDLRVSQFQTALSSDSAKRAKNCSAEIEQLRQAQESCAPFLKALAAGQIPERLTHADLKLNNILFDQKSVEPLCLVDLDTCMAGSVVFDFGDLARSVCLSCEEDQRDLDQVQFRLDLFEVLAESYLTHAKFLIAEEKAHLPSAAALVAYCLALRFLADHLNGDLYFKAAYPEHNLVRARVQIKLMQQIWLKLDRLSSMFHT